MHLALLQQQGLIAAWHDRKISAGTEWAHEIDTHLDAARIILLLISSSFLASKYCYSSEMARALQRHQAGIARVIPIILRPVDWESAPFSNLQVLPTDGRPITGRGWHNIDEAFTDVAQGIRKAVDEIRSQHGNTNQVIESEKDFNLQEHLVSSHVVLIDVSLDPSESPYEETIENGRKQIRYKDSLSRRKEEDYAND
jgi:hypothetical protein